MYAAHVRAYAAVQEFLAVMDKKENHPVLVHCFAGIHRTGTMCAIFRIEYHGEWTVSDLLQVYRYVESRNRVDAVPDYDVKTWIHTIAVTRWRPSRVSSSYWDRPDAAAAAGSA